MCKLLRDLSNAAAFAVADCYQSPDDVGNAENDPCDAISACIAEFTQILLGDVSVDKE